MPGCNGPEKWRSGRQPAGSFLVPRRGTRGSLRKDRISSLGGWRLRQAAVLAGEKMSLVQPIYLSQLMCHYECGQTAIMEMGSCMLWSRASLKNAACCSQSWSYRWLPLHLVSLGDKAVKIFFCHWERIPNRYHFNGRALRKKRDLLRDATRRNVLTKSLLNQD